METDPEPGSSLRRRMALVSAWAVMLCISDLPEIVWSAWSGQPPGWLAWAKVALLAGFVVAASAWRRLRPLRSYGVVLLGLFLALRLSAWVGSTAWWQGHFGGSDVSFTRGFTGIYLLDAGVALVVIAALCAVKGRPRHFFLVKGQLDAPIAPVPWLGIRSGESWRTFGWIFALAAGAAVLVPTVFASVPSAAQIARAAPLLPAVVVFAAVNAFNEEVYFRASLLSTLHAVLGTGHTLLLSATFFGLAHYLYGSPPGIVGVLMTGFLAWLLGKSMLETRGFLWAWFIHFVPDVVIFASYALARAQR